MSTKTAKMKPGDTVTVRSGEFAGMTATVIDPKPFPDTDLSRRRKITVEVDGEAVYILPRMLDTTGAKPRLRAVPTDVQPGVVAETPQGDVVLVPGDITDPMDPRLDPWRPDPAIVKRYVSRTMANGSKDVDFLATFHARRENVLLVGDTQSGKTMLVQVLAVVTAKRDGMPKPYPVFGLSGSAGVTDQDLFTQVTTFVGPDGRDRLVSLPGTVELAVKAGGYLYLDEVNMMSERVTSSLHPITDYRRAFINRQRAVRVEHEGTEVFTPEVVEGHPDLWVIGTINPAGYRGTSMNEAFLNRFTHIPWSYDEAVEKRLVPSPGVRLLGQALREARAQRAISTPIGTAALARMCEHVDAYGVEMASWLVVGMFLPQEQPKVEAIIRDRSIKMLLEDEQAAKAAGRAPEPAA